MRYRNYIFDLYGTLADIWTDEEDPALWEKTAAWYAARGADWTGPDLQAAYLAHCRRWQESRPDPFYEIELRRVFEELFEEKGVHPEAWLTDKTAVYFRTCSTRKLEVYPWVNGLFERLRAGGARLYLLSNAQACFTRPELRLLGLADAFDGIVLSSDAGVRKPDPRIMRKLLEENGLAVLGSVMIGNDRLTDVAVARAVGMDCLYLETATSRHDLREPRADYEILRGWPPDHGIFQV
nr:HAD family hydrolase [Lachnospiraceae bacterium]